MTHRPLDWLLQSQEQYEQEERLKMNLCCESL